MANALASSVSTCMASAIGTDADDDIRENEGALITFHDHEHLVIVFYIHLDTCTGVIWMCLLATMTP